MDIQPIEMGTISITPEQIQSIIQFCKNLPFNLKVIVPEVHEPIRFSFLVKWSVTNDINNSISEFIYTNDKIIEPYFRSLKNTGQFWQHVSSNVPWGASYIIAYLYSKHIIDVYIGTSIPMRKIIDSTDIKYYTVKRIVPDDEIILKFTGDVF